MFILFALYILGLLLSIILLLTKPQIMLKVMPKRD